MQELGRKKEKEIAALFFGRDCVLVCFGLDFWAFRYDSYLWTINNGIGVVLMGMMRLEIKMKCIVLVVMARMLGYAHFDWHAN